MHSFYFLLALIILAAILGLREYFSHQARIVSIPIRIHINGTRGKSSVTRLIGAGLRAGGISTITKVTGTFPRLILEDGTETFIHRKSDANIIEQLSIVKFAALRKTKALVMECMALQPQYQTITEKQMVRSNVSVITNVRLDHTDVMGYTLMEIADTIGRTIARNEHFFTAESIIPDKLLEIANHQNAVSHIVDSRLVTQEEMKNFRYIEHRDNVALALAVCEHLNVDRQTALKGMYTTIPDAGALRCLVVEAFKKKILFYNAFAANDPDSSYMVWHKIRDEGGFEGSQIVLLNTRQDRLDRARQLADMIGKKLVDELDFLILIGQSTEVVEYLATNAGLPGRKIINLGWTTPAKVFEKVLSVTVDKSTVVAMGNMGGMGAETAEFFENRSSKQI
jgi:poly-gamma-glutamate synthase PgsB/CapB